VDESGVVVCARTGTAMLIAAVAMAKTQRFMNGFLSDVDPHAIVTRVRVRGSDPAASGRRQGNAPDFSANGFPGAARLSR
jgi:hypothetical protein